MSKNILHSNSGQGLTEYTVILCLVVVASIVTMGLFGGVIKGKVASLSGAIAGQKISEVTTSENIAKKAAKDANKNASDIKGNTAITKRDISE